jgi:hypothetical protein
LIFRRLGGVPRPFGKKRVPTPTFVFYIGVSTRKMQKKPSSALSRPTAFSRQNRLHRQSRRDYFPVST